jgi:TP901 family phage tail tape measure protein
MAKRNEVSILITAIDQASQTLLKTTGAVDNLDRRSDQAGRSGLNSLQQKLQSVINPATLAAAGVTAVTIAVNDAVRTAGEFERFLTNVESLGAHSAEEMENLRQSVLNLAPAVGEGPSQLTDALYDIVSAGFTTEEAMAVLEASAMGAKAGLTDTKTAADAVTTALNAYGMSGRDASIITDQIQTAVRLGKTTWGELGGTLGQVIPLAATAGVSFDELNAAVATTTSVGIGTSQAITGIRAAIANIIQPSSQAAQLAADLGIEFNAQALKAKGLSGVLEDVREKTGGNTESMSTLFGSVEALNTVLALTSDEGAAKFLEAQQAMRDSVGATKEAFDTQQQTLQAAQERYAAAMESIKISIGTIFLPVIASATDKVADFLTVIVEWQNAASP